MNRLPRILVIDDDRDWLEALTEYLRLKGYVVLPASSAAQGMDLIGRNDISLIICDYNMPGMDGLDLARWAHEHAHPAAILLLSSDERPSLAREALAAGAQGLLSKCASPTLLLRKIRQTLDLGMHAADGSSALDLWQRLLPGPETAGRHRGKDRPAAHAQRIEARPPTERAPRKGRKAR